MQAILDWFFSLEWHRLVPEMIGKAMGFLLGFGASWFLLFRRRLREIERFQQGDSDDIIYQFHKLVPLPEDEVGLLFRNVGPKTTVNKLFDNPAARDLLKKLADQTTLTDPVLATEGTGGYELLNDTFSNIAGHLALTPFPREIWLFAMTCEDRQVVRKKCVRCALSQTSPSARHHDVMNHREHAHLAVACVEAEAAQFFTQISFDHRHYRLDLPALRVSAAFPASLGPQSRLHESAVSA